MSARRPLALAATVALVITGVAGSAEAAKRPKTKPKAIPPVCNLVTDPTGDTFLLRSQDTVGQYGPQEDALDLTGMDIATNATSLTAVIRVKTLATKVQTAPLGTDYRVQFYLPGEAAAENIFLNARTDATGTPSYAVGTRTVLAQGQSLTAKLGDATGTFDLAKNEIHMTIPLSMLAGHGATTPGSKIAFAGLDQTSARSTVVNPVTGFATATFADVANSDKIYVAGTPSCVTVGK